MRHLTEPAYLGLMTEEEKKTYGRNVIKSVGGGVLLLAGFISAGVGIAITESVPQAGGSVVVMAIGGYLLNKYDNRVVKMDDLAAGRPQAYELPYENSTES